MVHQPKCDHTDGANPPAASEVNTETNIKEHSMSYIFSRTGSHENDPFCGVSMGDLVKDTLSGFTGVVIARSEHMTGCNQVFVLPKSDKDNELKDGLWFDIERIEKLAERFVTINERRTGADIPSPRTTGPQHPRTT